MRSPRWWSLHALSASLSGAVAWRAARGPRGRRRASPHARPGEKKNNGCHWLQGNACGLHRDAPREPSFSYCITAAGLLDMKSLVNGRNAAKGSRQTGCAPSEDAVAPEARPRGPVGSADVGGRRGLGRATTPLVGVRGRPGPASPRPTPDRGHGRSACGGLPRASHTPRAAPVATQWPTWNCCRAGESDCLIETQLREGVPPAGPSR